MKRFNKLVACIALGNICLFAAGFGFGYDYCKSDMKTYVGEVVAKEYRPEEYKTNHETKMIEKYEEDYSVKVRDHAGDIVSISVSKDEFNQIDIGLSLIHISEPTRPY